LSGHESGLPAVFPKIFFLRFFFKFFNLRLYFRRVKDIPSFSEGPPVFLPIVLSCLSCLAYYHKKSENQNAYKKI